MEVASKGTDYLQAEAMPGKAQGAHISYIFKPVHRQPFKSIFLSFQPRIKQCAFQWLDPA
jgi:hypothetical protein